MLRSILIVDDVKTNRFILKGALQNAYNVLEAGSGAEALQMLSDGKNALSAVLLDISMPGMDGYEVLRRIRSDARMASMPVIMITGSEEEESRVKSLSMGANDYVTKPYNLDIIRHCLRNQIAFQEAEETVLSLQRDRLTGLYNRDVFFERASALIAAQPAGYYVLGCLDINNFKVINDQYGSQKGDEVLKALADVLKRVCVEQSGICGRIASDNFITLRSHYFMQNYTSGLERFVRYVYQQTGIQVTLSVGRYLVDDKELSISAMYDRAKIAQRTVKGRYDVHVAMFDAKMLEHILREQEIVLEMGAALENREFEPWFQPQYNHTTDSLIGAEALTRWRHPKRGLVPPGEFIPLFEQNGFIYSLDKYIWEEVCRCLRRWTDEGREPLPVSVNVSWVDILCPDVVEVLTALMRKYDLPLHMLRLEVTESSFATDADRVIAVVKELIDLGFTVEIDDFGSGYSSLNTLKDVPAQILKLDMKFLQSTSDSQRGGNIVESVVRMAKWLGMSVIAEGVETIAQADYLRSIGCVYVQGYYFAKPMPVEAYEAHFEGRGKEERLLALETVEHLDNDRLWDPDSIDSLVFNSYVGGACIFEYNAGEIEMLRVTEVFVRMFGEEATAEKLLKLDWMAHLDSESTAMMTSRLRESAANKKQVAAEFVFTEIPGCPRKVYLRAVIRVIATAGDRMLVYCSNENITAQREAERQADEAAEQIRAIMENVNGGISAVTFDAAGQARFVFANEQYYGILGYTRAQFVAEVSDAMELVHPDDAEETRRTIAAVLQTRRPTSYEYRCRKRDGSTVYLRCNAACTAMEGVGDQVLLGVVVDVTAEKLTKVQLEAIMDNVISGVTATVVRGDHMRRLFANDRYYTLMGLERTENETSLDSRLTTVVPEDREIIRANCQAVNDTGEPRSVEYRIQKPDGQIRWLRTNITLMQYPGLDEPVQLAVTTDITDLGKTQRDLLDNLPGGAGLYELNNGRMSLIYQNQNYWEMVGLGDAAYPDPAPMSAIHPDDIPLIMRELTEAIQKQQDVACDIRLRHLTKGYRHVHLAARVLPKEAGVFLIYASFTLLDSESLLNKTMLPLLLSAIMESSNDYVFAKDKDFRYLCASPAFLRLAGLKDQSDVKGKTDGELFPPNMAERFRENDIALFEKGAALVDFNETIFTPDGEEHFCRASKYILRDAAGEIIGLYGISRDITKERTTAEQLQLVNDSLPIGMATYVFTTDAVSIRYCNDGFCALFGGTRKGLEKRTDVDPVNWVFEEDQPILEKQNAAMFANGTPSDCTLRVHTLDGGYKWLNYKAVRSEKTQDKVIVNAILIDVSEQYRMMERLRMSEEENMLAVAHGGNIVCRYSVADRKLTMDATVAATYSLPVELTDVPEEPVRNGMISAETAGAYTAFFDGIRKGNQAGSVLFQQKYFGDWRWIEAKSTTIFSNDGKPVKAVVSMFDVTERLEKETVYKKWQQSLQDMAPDSHTLYRCNLNSNRTYDSKDGNLITFDFDGGNMTLNERARIYAEECVFDEDRERYLAFMNRDAMLAAYYSGKRSDSMEYRELLTGDKVRWLRLTIDLVESPDSSDVEAFFLYEDIDKGKRTELQTKALSENDPLTGILNRAAFTARVDQMLRAAAPGTKSAMLMLDIDGFKRVNDVFGHGAGDQTLISIAHGLRGMVREQDLAARLGGDEFVVFLTNIREESDATEKAKQICDLTRKAFSLEVQISGSVGVVVAPRDGTDFATLYKKADAALYYVKGSGKDNIALYSERMEDEHLEPEADAVGADARQKLKKRRMLIVDDNSIDHAMLQNIFEDDFIIEKAKDGNTALIRLRHYGNAISMVLLDLMMPGMDGFAVLEAMQENPELRSIPVIIVSGDESRETCLKAIRKGAMDFVTKPVDPDVLRIRVRSAVSKAENERLRAKNYVLEVQNEERMRYDEMLEYAGSAFIEYNWHTGKFGYHPSISRYLLGVYDDRPLWRILLSDLVADTHTVQDMQQLVHRIAESREQTNGSLQVRLRTPDKEAHAFRMNVHKLTNEFQLTSKLIITLTDVDAPGKTNAPGGE